MRRWLAHRSGRIVLVELVLFVVVQHVFELFVLQLVVHLVVVVELVFQLFELVELFVVRRLVFEQLVGWRRQLQFLELLGLRLVVGFPPVVIDGSGRAV